MQPPPQQHEKQQVKARAGADATTCIANEFRSADKTNGTVGLRRTFSLSEGHILHK